MTTSASVMAAYELVGALVSLGVREVVLAPGSRSAPLAYALASASQGSEPSLRLHVRIDERDAGFLALGLAKAGDGAPVAVVTTSGTAVANLLPAVLEAHHSGVPLLLLTADRPHELRGTGANQTADQVGIFGGAARFAADVPAPSGRDGELQDLRALASRAVAAATGARSVAPGPVHLNLAYRDPLAPSAQDRAVLAADGGRAVRSLRGLAHVVATGAAQDDPAVLALRLETEGATVVVAGDGAGAAAGRLAEARGWPLLAEVSSGVAGGPAVVSAHRLVLSGSPLAEQIRQVVVLGRPTVSRPVQALLARSDVRVVVVAPGTQQWPDAARNAAVVLDRVPDAWLEPSAPEQGPSGWLGRWRGASEAAAEVIDAVLAAGSAPDGDLTALDVAAAVARATEAGDVLVIGSSSPVRDLELVARWRTPVQVVANRGLAGIDGTVSTALGVALAVQRAVPDGAGGAGRGAEEVARATVRALLGDLTFLHDVGGLLRGPHEHSAQLQMVVVNDGGGAIFDTLEHGRVAQGTPADAAVFERVFGTPHTADLSALCAGYGVGHEVVTDLARLAQVLAGPGAGLSVVEVRVSRAGRGEAGRRLARAVEEALVAAAEGSSSSGDLT